MKVLLAEDDRNLGRLLSMLLRKQNIIVEWTENGNDAYEKCYSDGYDVLILDWMLPGMSGVELCRKLRDEEYSGKILLLTARDTVEDKVEGLNSGADDYMVKPFDVQELVARLNALLRRPGQYTAENITYGKYVLERSSHSFVCGDKKIELRPREFKLLEILLNNRGQIIPREILQERVWGINNDVTENNLDVHIRLLRKKIMDLADENIIHTARGVGYYVE